MSLSRTIFTACATSLIAIGAFAAQPEGLQGVAAAERYRGAQEGVEAIKLQGASTVAPVAPRVTEQAAMAGNTEAQRVYIGGNTEAQRVYIGGNTEAQRRAWDGGNVEAQRRAWDGGNVEAQRRAWDGGNVEAQRVHIDI